MKPLLLCVIAVGAQAEVRHRTDTTNPGILNTESCYHLLVAVEEFLSLFPHECHTVFRLKFRYRGNCSGDE